LIFGVLTVYTCKFTHWWWRKTSWTSKLNK